MSRIEKLKKILFIILFLVMPFVLQLGCEDNLIDQDNDHFQYIFNGVLIQNTDPALNRTDFNYLAIKTYRDNILLNTAELNFNDTALNYSSYPFTAELFYRFAVGNKDYMSGGNYMMDFNDSTFLVDTVTAILPDSIYVVSYNPDSTTTYNPNNGVLVIDWTSAPNIDGYVLAATPVDSIYTGYGYTAFVTSLTNSDAFPPQAFRSPSDTDQVVTGDYFLYVYGYNGVPDKDLADIFLPVPFPSQIPNNINRNQFTGHFGSVVVSRRVPIEVISQ
jgi:hypothetical protein